MATEPKLHADELLKRYVQQRRAQAGALLEMPAATRNGLQAAIARAFTEPAERRAPPARRGAGWWARLAWGGAALAGAVALCLVLWPGARTRPQRARAPGQETGERASAKLPAVPTIQEEALRPATSERELERGVSTVARAAPNRSATGAIGTALSIRGVGGGFGGGEFRPGVGSGINSRLGLTTGAPAVRFAQPNSLAAFPGLRPSVAAASVLASFALERARDRVRIIDADGSVYDGRVVGSLEGGVAERRVEPGGQPLRTEARELLDRVESLKTPPTPKVRGGSSGPGAAAVGGYAFRASGTNRTLHQLIVFDGEVLSKAGVASLQTSNGPPSQFLGLRRFERRAVALAAPPRPASGGPTGRPPTVLVSGELSVSKPSPAGLLIQGEVVVGGTNRFRLEAVPVVPEAK